ncbi:MAG: DUF2059 domain-containing protein [Bacteroidota bacterium]
MLRRSLACLGLLSTLAAGPHALAQEFSPSHLEAAEELLIQANTERNMQVAMEGMLQAQVQQNPALAQVEDVMREFFAEYLSWDVLKDEMIRLYADAFTEDELREISAFYRTPTGQKSIAKMPTLMMQGMQLGQRQVEENASELERRVLERLAELEGQE